MLSQAFNRTVFHRNVGQADVAVIEGVMGLFDGYDGRSEAGSTAQMAKWLKAPVLLTVDARSMARSAAALVQGFERFDPDLNFAGVVFNRVGSPRHLSYLTEALAGHVAMPCWGAIPRDEPLAIPQRHLGLVTRDDHCLDQAFTERLAEVVENHLDLDGLMAALPDLDAAAVTFENKIPDANVAIAVARDPAFCFYYPENLELLQQYGAEIKRFSPIHDAALPKNVDGIYLGGGYPELFAQQLAANESLRREIRKMSLEGMPIYGECGGLMYLGTSIQDPQGTAYPMTECLPLATRMLPRLKRLGYREVTLTQATILGPPGRVIRGHEFHYSEISERPQTLTTSYAIKDRTGRGETGEGFQSRCTLGSYVHLHWGSCPEAAQDFVKACRRYQKERRAVH